MRSGGVLEITKDQAIGVFSFSWLYVECFHKLPKCSAGIKLCVVKIVKVCVCVVKMVLIEVRQTVSV